MRYGRFRLGDRAFHAQVDGDVAHELAAAPWDGAPRTGDVHALTSLAFLPPVIPQNFYAAGFNYRAHNRHHEDLGYDPVKVGDHPEPGYRSPSALIGHLEAIVKPTGVEGRFEAEAEVVAVIGRELRRASRWEAEDAIFGWTIGNDVSAREWQHADRTFYRAKNSDTFKPMGPWIETDAEPMSATTTVTVNGETRASFATGDMIYDPCDFIVEATKYATMRPCDILWMGADGAVGIAPGDSVGIDITGIGRLTSPVVAETAAADDRSPTTQGAQR